MTSDDTPAIFDEPPRRTPFDFPHILATVIVTGIGTLIVVGFLLLPQLDQGREEARNTSALFHCRLAHADLTALPSEQRLAGHQVLGRVPPNLVIMEFHKAGEWDVPLRAALTEPDSQTVRHFIPRDFNAPLTNGQYDYTIENAEVFLAQAKASRRRQWMVFLTVWLATWSFFSWRLLLQARRQANGATQ